MNDQMKREALKAFRKDKGISGDMPEKQLRESYDYGDDMLDTWLRSWQLATQAAYTEAQRAVVENCNACGGHGYIVVTGTGMGHGCGGDDEACRRMCPVPVPIQEQQQCEYCGLPCAAIRSLSQGELEAPAPVHLQRYKLWPANVNGRMYVCQEKDDKGDWCLYADINSGSVPAPVMFTDAGTGTNRFGLAINPSTTSSPVTAEGWISVPMNPTREQIRAGAEIDNGYGMCVTDSVAEEVYRVMLTAAPKVEG